MMPFLSLLLLYRRPNLGLFGANVAPHTREKGNRSLPILKSPISLIRIKVKKNLTGNFLYVKSEFSIFVCSNIIFFYGARLFEYS